MKKSKTKWSAITVCALLLAVIGCLFFVPELSHAASSIHETLFNSASGVGMAIAATPAYYAANSGKPVYSNSQLQAAANANASGVSIPNAPCICDSQRPYSMPQFITLTATSTGIASLAKITPFDDVAEAVAGTLGTIFFGVQEIKNGAGTIARQDGTLIYAADNIRQITATRMIVCDKGIMTGTDLAALQSKDLNYVRGFVSGNDNTLLKFQLPPNYNAAVVTLEFYPQDTLGGLLYWKSNEGFQYQFTTAGGTIQIQWRIVGFQYYGN